MFLVSTMKKPSDKLSTGEHVSRMFYNPDLGWMPNCVLFWAWESIFHHLYFIVLFLQRQVSDTWATGELWRLNMEKECGFFSQLFGGDPTLCAESTMTLFSGIWFSTPNPTNAQLNWVGRLVTNFQHSEATIHFCICIFGLLLCSELAKCRDTNQALDAPAFLRWGFFLALFFETWTMCVPYLVLFGWAWDAVIANPDGSHNAIVDTLTAMGKDPYSDGIVMGASLITMFWVSVIVLILDAWAMYRAWQFAMKTKSNWIIDLALFGGCTAAFMFYLQDFFTEGSRGSAGVATLSTRTLDALHGFFGGEGNVSMLDVARDHLKSEL